MKFVVNLRPGGADAWRAVSGETSAIKKSLTPLSQETYGTGIDTITFFVFVSGDMDQYPDPNGVGKIVLHKSKNAGRAEIIMHQDVWRQGDARVRAFMRDAVLSATSLIVERAAQASLDVDKKKLLDDIRRALG